MQVGGFAGRLASLAAGWALWLAVFPAAHAGGCRGEDPLQARDLGSRIAAVACREHRLWHQPFIDIDGHLASTTVAEMETGRLADGVTPAWKRVVDYWRGSGLMGAVAQRPGAGTCEYVTNDSYASPNCRGFLIDTPWSAAFVSYVMVQSGVPGFEASPSHVDYVRNAYRDPGSSPFLVANPQTEAPADGDLLCFVRGASAVTDHAGLMSWLGANGSGALAMHCDVVVDADGGHDGRAYLVGGNVLQGVTMRILPVNRTGRFWNLPRQRDMGNPKACSFNNQYWVALLKLKPGLPMRAPPATPTWQQAVPDRRCCVHCVVGSGIPRCPSPPPAP